MAIDVMTHRAVERAKRDPPVPMYQLERTNPRKVFVGLKAARTEVPERGHTQQEDDSDTTAVYPNR